MNSEFCIFHDKDHYAKHEQEAAKRFEDKVKKSIEKNEPLECFGYYLPAINFAELLEGKSFAQPVYFNEATFYKDANFSKTKFSGDANFYRAIFSRLAYFPNAIFSKQAYFLGAKFSGDANFSIATFSKQAYFDDATFSKETTFYLAKFLNEAYFILTKFTGITLFQVAIFEQPNKVIVSETDLSKVSFAACDITRIRFEEPVIWGGRDKITIIEEKWLADSAAWETFEVTEETKEYVVELETVLSVYRNLRENYEFRLRYDKAGKLFIKEMELKRKYREIETENGTEIKKNGRFRRYFSLTSLYYHLSRYGESISRPAIIGAIAVLLSTLFWVMQSNPTLEPHFDPTLETVSTSTFVGPREFYNGTQWLKSLERSFADFLPLLPAGDFKVGMIDYIIKIVGGALTFGLLIIALRRRFERKYTR